MTRPSLDSISPNEAESVPLFTPAEAVEWKGNGLHTGNAVSVRVEPKETPGIRFWADGVEIPALAEYVSDTRRCTVLSHDGASVGTVEHLLAALSGLGLWSAAVHVDGPELPILDGSAAPFVEGLVDAGRTAVGRIDPLRLGTKGSVEDEGAYRRWEPAEEGGSATFLMAGDHLLLSGQTATLSLGDPSAFADEVASARTWSPIEQVQPLIDQGLIRGGSLDNALVVFPDHYSSPLRMPEEPARHKLLDLIGDLALVGRPLALHLTAQGGGHTLNIRLAQILRGLAASNRPKGSETTRIGEKDKEEALRPGGAAC